MENLLPVAFDDSGKPYGKLRVVALRGKRPESSRGGFRIDPVKTSIVASFFDTNMVVDSGRVTTNRVMNGFSAADPISFLAVGSGGYEGAPSGSTEPRQPSADEIALRAPIADGKFAIPFEGADPGHSSGSTGWREDFGKYTIYHILIDKDDLIGSEVSEWALLTSTDAMFSYRTTKAIPKPADVYFAISWTIQF